MEGNLIEALRRSLSEVWNFSPEKKDIIRLIIKMDDMGWHMTTDYPYADNDN